MGTRAVMEKGPGPGRPRWARALSAARGQLLHLGVGPKHTTEETVRGWKPPARALLIVPEKGFLGSRPGTCDFTQGGSMSSGVALD